MVRILVRWTITSETLRSSQVEQAAEHVALGLGDAALLVQQVDLAADFLGRPRASAAFAPMADAEGPQHQPHHALDGRCVERARAAPRPRTPAARGAARRWSGDADRDGLRQHLGEDDDEDRHHDRRVDARRSCRRSPTSTLVVKAEAPIVTMLLPISIAPMNRSRMAEQPVDDRRRAGRPLFSSASMRAREAAVKAVSAPAKKAESTRRQDDDQRRRARDRSRSGSSIVARTDSPAISLGQEGAHLSRPRRRGATKLWPMPRARMKVSAPAFTFLSCAMASSSASARRRSRPGHRASAVGRPTVREMAPRPAPRPAAGQSPSRAEKRKARHRPMATRLAMDEPGGVVAGDALERVAEGVAEVEQRAVAVLALVAHDDGGLRRGSSAATASSRSGPPAKTPRQFASHQSKKRGVVDQAVFHHLGIAGAHLAQGQRVEQRRCRRARGSAGGRRRRGSCRGAN